jgi:hypothetical protein
METSTNGMSLITVGSARGGGVKRIALGRSLGAAISVGAMSTRLVVADAHPAVSRRFVRRVNGEVPVIAADR